MSLVVHVFGAGDLGFPRVSGDEPQVIDEDLLEQVFSPRERG